MKKKNKISDPILKRISLYEDREKVKCFIFDYISSIVKTSWSVVWQMNRKFIKNCEKLCHSIIVKLISIDKRYTYINRKKVAPANKPFRLANDKSQIGNAVIQSCAHIDVGINCTIFNVYCYLLTLLWFETP